MADEKMTRQVSIPGWTIEASKVIASVAIALAIGYARFASIEGKVAAHEVALTSLVVKSEANKDKSADISQKVNTMEVQQSLVSGEFRDSLKRIEDDVKELKADFKTVKKTAP